MLFEFLMRWAVIKELFPSHNRVLVGHFILVLSWSPFMSASTISLSLFLGMHISGPILMRVYWTSACSICTLKRQPRPGGRWAKERKGGLATKAKLSWWSMQATIHPLKYLNKWPQSARRCWDAIFWFRISSLEVYTGTRLAGLYLCGRSLPCMGCHLNLKYILSNAWNHYWRWIP